MKLVVLESPYAGDVERNLLYLTACVRDSLSRGEAPYASHGFYTLYLDDDIPAQRRQGMEAGFAWGSLADLTAVYYDLGISPGMAEGIQRAIDEGRPIEFRDIKGWRPVPPQQPEE